MVVRSARHQVAHGTLGAVARSGVEIDLEVDA
jgi:hypothetical protein